MSERVVAFLSKIGNRETGKCWEWKGSLNNRGYGWFCFDAGMILAHRFSWMFINGDIPDGLCVLHRCDNRKCVNPEHLFLGTVGDNNRDMFRKGRGVLGPGYRKQKLNPDQVCKIRKMWVPYKFSMQMIAEHFGISRKLVESAIYKWKGITNAC